MLKPATEYRAQLQALFTSVQFQSKYNFVSYIGEAALLPHLEQHELVSVDRNNNVIGYINYVIDLSQNIAISFTTVSFTDTLSIHFSSDLYHALDDIFCKIKLEAVYFTIFVGHPLENTYHQIVHKYGGAFLGYEKKLVQWIDGKQYRLKRYKFIREGWLQRKERARQGNAK